MEPDTIAVAPTTPKSPRKAPRALLALLALAVIAAGVYFYLNTMRTTSSDVLFSFEINGFERLYTYEDSGESKAYVPYVINTDELERLPVIDVYNSEQKQLLIVLETSEQANVYEHKEGKYLKITDTPSIKRHISYDQISDTIAYEVKGISEQWQIATVGRNGEEKLTNVSTSNSALLPGGNAVLAVQDNKLQLVSLSGQAPVELMEVYSPTTVAFNIDTTKIAVLNPVSKTINTYSYTPDLGLSFDSASEAQETLPTSVSFDGSDIVAAYSERSNGVSSLALRSLTSSSELRIPQYSIAATLTQAIYE